MVVASIANPGGNITGLSAYTTGLEGKRAEVVKELVPGAVRIAGLYNMGSEAVQRPTMRCVPIKTAEQQAAHRLPEVARQVLQVLAAQLEQIEAAIGAGSPPS